MESGKELNVVLRALDVVAVVAILAVTFAGILNVVPGPTGWIMAVLFGSAIALPLLVRRRAPLAVACVVMAATAMNAAINGLAAGDAGPWFALLLAIYSAGTHMNQRRAILGGLVIVVPSIVIGADKMRDGEDASALFSPLFLLAAVWVAGRVAAGRRRRDANVEVRARQLETAAAELEAKAAERERARIARELHDVVTHGMSVMVVQSQAAQSLADTDVDQARTAMRAVEEAGREALGEMRRLLGIIRSGEPPDRTPAPRLSDIDDLIERVRQAGLPMTYQPIQADPARAVPAGVAVSAYRIVQEALTNVVKHAGLAQTEVRVRLADAALEVTVTNRLPAPSPPERSLAGTGAGLAGMRERVAVFGGRLEAGRLPEGMFKVHAVLPLEQA